MASGLNDYLNEKFNIEPKDIRTYSPLTLAYIGDAIFDVVIRSILVNKGNTAVNKLHQRTSSVVKAPTQAKMAAAIMEDFTEEDTQMANKHIKIFPTLVSREVHIKTTTR